VIFKQRRYGLDGREITVYKFRSMTVTEDGHNTYTQVTRSDSRVTPLGAFLRRTSIDELPQFFNVLAGSMSVVGPRPHAISVNEHYRRLIPSYMFRHKVKPGITGWAQVNGFRGGDDLHGMTKRIEFDLEYLENWSLWLDVRIIVRTCLLIMAIAVRTDAGCRCDHDAHSGRRHWLGLIALCCVTIAARSNDTESDYPIGPGDLLHITVFDHDELTTDARVSQSGNITFPMIGQQRVSACPRAKRK